MVKLVEHLTKAKEQLSSVREWSHTIHHDLFKDWTLVSAAAFPLVESSEFPNEDPQFLITKDRPVDVWWDEISKLFPAVYQHDTAAYEAYTEFMRRTIGLLKIGKYLISTQIT